MKISKTSKKNRANFCMIFACLMNVQIIFFLSIGFLLKIDIIRHKELENQLISRILRSNENVMKIMKNNEIMRDLRMTCDDVDDSSCIPI